MYAYFSRLMNYKAYTYLLWMMLSDGPQETASGVPFEESSQSLQILGSFPAGTIVKPLINLPILSFAFIFQILTKLVS